MQNNVCSDVFDMETCFYMFEQTKENFISSYIMTSFTADKKKSSSYKLIE